MYTLITEDRYGNDDYGLCCGFIRDHLFHAPNRWVCPFIKIKRIQRNEWR